MLEGATPPLARHYAADLGAMTQTRVLGMLGAILLISGGASVTRAQGPSISSATIGAHRVRPIEDDRGARTMLLARHSGAMGDDDDHPAYVARSMIIGALAGGLVGAVWCKPEDCYSRTFAVGFGALGGGALGLAIGIVLTELNQLKLQRVSASPVADAVLSRP